jgi:hypothetical protein
MHIVCQAPWMEFILMEEASRVEFQCLATEIWRKHPERRTNAINCELLDTASSPNNPEDQHMSDAEKKC